jgi:RND family efflux transporter MFP subunit
MAAYTVIKSPYNGVITKRNFHIGDFIRAATEGGGIPVLSVAREDLMRVVVPVPDLDVPFVEKGDEATIRFDALPGREFHGKVARFSASEESESRNMRTEIDLPNNDGKLRDGMWGRVTIVLEPPSPNCVTVPSGSLIDQDGSGGGMVYVVRDGKAKKVPVRVGKDDGTSAEILDGVSPSDQVIVRYTGAIEDAAAVTVESSTQATGAH